jgi:hypothetical protein
MVQPANIYEDRAAAGGGGVGAETFLEFPAGETTEKRHNGVQRRPYGTITQENTPVHRITRYYLLRKNRTAARKRTLPMVFAFRCPPSGGCMRINFFGGGKLRITDTDTLAIEKNGQICKHYIEDFYEN